MPEPNHVSDSLPRLCRKIDPSKIGMRNKEHWKQVGQWPIQSLVRLIVQGIDLTYSFRLQWITHKACPLLYFCCTLSALQRAAEGKGPINWLLEQQNGPFWSRNNSPNFHRLDCFRHHASSLFVFSLTGEGDFWKHLLCHRDFDSIDFLLPSPVCTI